MTTTTQAPRFRTTGRRGLPFDEELLYDPLPPVLASLGGEVSERIEQHRALASKLTTLQAQRVELEREAEERTQDHERRVQEAIVRGAKPPKGMAAAGALTRLENVERELQAFVNALPESANNLLVFVVGYFARATERVAEEEESAARRSEDLRRALNESIVEREELAAQRLWLVDALNATVVEPYRKGGSGDHNLARLRHSFALSFAEYEKRREELETEEERARRQGEAERPVQEAREELWRREAAERRVVIDHSSARIVERGGRPVERSPFGGVQPVEGDEG